MHLGSPELVILGPEIGPFWGSDFGPYFAQFRGQNLPKTHGSEVPPQMGHPEMGPGPWFPLYAYINISDGVRKWPDLGSIGYPSKSYKMRVMRWIHFQSVLVQMGSDLGTILGSDFGPFLGFILGSYFGPFWGVQFHGFEVTDFRYLKWLISGIWGVWFHAI